MVNNKITSVVCLDNNILCEKYDVLRALTLDVLNVKSLAFSRPNTKISPTECVKC